MDRAVARLSGLIATLMLSLAATACDADSSRAADGEPKPPMGLFSTLPIYWGEGDVSTILEEQAAPGPVRLTIERRFDLRPLDALEKEDLAGLDALMLAQPRPLAPSENVALDAWVREGGDLLLFADPMLTHHSRYPLGDRRRPQAVVLLSPILARWGIELRFDADQPARERTGIADGVAYPVNLAGRFVASESGGEDATCTIEALGLMAHCRVGAGEVTLFADAALLEEGRGSHETGQRKALLDHLLVEAFGG